MFLIKRTGITMKPPLVNHTSVSWSISRQASNGVRAQGQTTAYKRTASNEAFRFLYRRRMAQRIL
ncbi:hypothetical protein [Negadavirga shengliensis]|uniref:Uncharacterized protein n=1 Tax=Negadavirga shengliensis TaxID=1389218 RepID=A0ABV9T665_9BACT